jgi:anti-anti-sigma regulatory factor
VPFCATVHQAGGADLRVDVRGQVLGAAAADLRLLIVDVIVDRLPDSLLINLHQVTALSVAGVRGLVAGYITAIDNGTTYRVLNAHGQARRILQSTATIDVLADSNDLGSLLLAVLGIPEVAGSA